MSCWSVARTTSQKRSDFPFPLDNLSLYIHAFLKDAGSLSCHLILYSNIEIRCLSMFDSDQRATNKIEKSYKESV